MRAKKRNILLFVIFFIAFGIYLLPNIMNAIFNSMYEVPEGYVEYIPVVPPQELNYMDQIETGLYDKYSFSSSIINDNKLIVFADTQNDPLLFDLSDPKNLEHIGYFTGLNFKYGTHNVIASKDLIFDSRVDDIEGTKIFAYNISDLNNPVEYNSYETMHQLVDKMIIKNDLRVIIQTKDKFPPALFF